MKDSFEAVRGREGLLDQESVRVMKLDMKEKAQQSCNLGTRGTESILAHDLWSVTEDKCVEND